MEDQHKEPKQEEEPTDQLKEEAEAAKPEEPKERRKEEEEQPDVDKPEEPKDQRKEAAAEEDKSEELTGQRKAAAAEEEKEKEKETERSQEEESTEASSPFVHPCSQLLQYLARACAWCLGMPDSFDDGGGATPSSSPAASPNSSREVRVGAVNKGSDSTGVYYMQEVIMRVRAYWRPRPGGGNPREGPGGNGGVHH